MSNTIIFSTIYNNNNKYFLKHINNSNIDIQDKDGNTLLIISIKYSNNNYYIFELLKRGIDINIVDNNKYTAISHTILQNKAKLAIDIINYYYNYSNNFDVNYQDKNGMTYLMLSCICIQDQKLLKKLIKQLFKCGAVNDLRNNSGFPASYYVKNKNLLNLIKNNGKENIFQKIF